MSLYRRIWQRIHCVANWLAWRYAAPPGGKWSAINRSHPLWRLNTFAADRWLPHWIADWTTRDQ